MTVNWGNLQVWSTLSEYFGPDFWEGYEGARKSKNYLHELPLHHRGLRINIVEAKRVVFIVSYRTYFPIATATESDAFLQAKFPELADFDADGDDDVREIARHLQIQEICSWRYPPSYEPARYHETMKEWTIDWGTEVAHLHMARTHPDFEEAKQRMVNAYEKLFELERRLREFMRATLEEKYKGQWWKQVMASFSDEVKEKIRKRQMGSRHSWLDDYDDSKMRFTDFDHFRQTIIHHGALFESKLPNREPLKSLLRDLSPLRNRIGHVNTLSEDDNADFHKYADRVIALIHPHERLE